MDVQALTPRALERLASLPPTDSLRTTLEAWRLDLERVTNEPVSPLEPLDAKPNRIKTHQLLLDIAERRCQDGVRRDAIQATRPDGCWCLGVGGKGQKMTPRLIADQVRLLFEKKVRRNGPWPHPPAIADHERPWFEKTCPACPEGMAQSEYQVKVSEYQVKVEAEAALQARERRIKRAWDNAGIPLRFHALRLHTHPAKHVDPIARVIAKLGSPSSPGDDAPETAMDAWRADRERWAKGAFLFGQSGTGKTGLAVGYAWELLQGELPQGDAVANILFIHAPKLFAELRSTYNRTRGDGGPTEDEVIAKYAEVSLLILDDLGAENVKSTDWLADRLFQIIGERHQQIRPTIITSNLSPQQLADKVGERVTWRIVEMVGPEMLLRVDGPNLRQSRPPLTKGFSEIC